MPLLAISPHGIHGKYYCTQKGHDTVAALAIVNTHSLYRRFGPPLIGVLLSIPFC